MEGALLLLNGFVPERGEFAADLQLAEQHRVPGAPDVAQKVNHHPSLPVACSQQQTCKEREDVEDLPRVVQRLRNNEGEAGETQTEAEQFHVEFLVTVGGLPEQVLVPI